MFYMHNTLPNSAQCQRRSTHKCTLRDTMIAPRPATKFNDACQSTAFSA